MDDELEFRSMVLDEMTDHRLNLVDLFAESEGSESHLKEIFRGLHSLKGTGKAGGFQAVAEVTHHYEDIISQVKEGEREYDEKLRDLFVDYLYWLEESLDLYRNNIHAAPDTENVMQCLHDYIQEEENQEETDQYSVEEDNNDSNENLSTQEPAQETVEEYYAPLSEDTLNILVIDDEQDIRYLLELYLLEAFKANLHQCGDGHTAYQLLQKYEYDFVILDNRLPGLNGIDILEKMNFEMGINMDTPILFLTGSEYDISNDNISIFKNVYMMKKPFKTDKIGYYINIMTKDKLKKAI